LLLLVEQAVVQQLTPYQMAAVAGPEVIVLVRDWLSIPTPIML
jgi:hypothetical protein